MRRCGNAAIWGYGNAALRGCGKRRAADSVLIWEKEGVYTLVYDAENRLVRVDAALKATATPTATMTSTATITSTPTVTATGGTPTETATQAVTATATLETTSMGASTATSVAATEVPTTASTVEPTATLTPEAPTATATPEAPTAAPATDIPATPVGALPGGVIMAAYHQQDAATETPVDSTATPEVSDTVEPTATLPAAEGNTASPVAPEAQTDSLMQVDSLTVTATATSAFTPTATTVPTEGPAQPLQNATYIYDADGNLVKSVINGRSTYYLGKLYQKQVDGTSTTIQKYYTSGSAQIAVRTVKDTNDTLQWLLSDHLGSTSTTANMDGTWNSTIQYSAFGEIRTSSGITPTEYRYTGQLRQPELGLYYYVARWYDPQIGHFVQADTVVQNSYVPSAYDRYSYVSNNPINNSDPTGHICIEKDSPDQCTKYWTDYGLAWGRKLGKVTVSNNDYYYGSWKGEKPDYKGIDIAEKYVKNNGSKNTVVAAAIAVQSQYVDPLIDNTSAWFTGGGIGIAQIARKDMAKYGVPGGDPLNPNDAIRAMEGRMNELTTICNGCNPTDILITKMLAQNNGVSPLDMKMIVNTNKSIIRNGDNIKWEDYFNGLNETSGETGNRALGHHNYNTRFMILLMYNDLVELQKRGWTMPEGVQWSRIIELTSGEPEGSK
jgi:RHS repeat-associated protein